MQSQLSHFVCCTRTTSSVGRRPVSSSVARIAIHFERKSNQQNNKYVLSFQLHSTLHTPPSVDRNKWMERFVPKYPLFVAVYPVAALHVWALVIDRSLSGRGVLNSIQLNWVFSTEENICHSIVADWASFRFSSWENPFEFYHFKSQHNTTQTIRYKSKWNYDIR